MQTLLLLFSEEDEAEEAVKPTEPEPFLLPKSAIDADFFIPPRPPIAEIFLFPLFPESKKFSMDLDFFIPPPPPLLLLLLLLLIVVAAAVLLNSISAAAYEYAAASR